MLPVKAVLIESDWNLKEFVIRLGSCGRNGINRIRLEFKVRKAGTGRNTGKGINRIRLEFKVSGITGIDFSVVY